jgi:predicted RNA-binding protein YlqC (UPF0109 family)
MEALVRHVVEPIVHHKDAVSLKTVEGEAVVMMELVVHPDDKARVDGDKGRTLRAIRNILSAAAGSRKATLDLVDAFRAEPDGDDEDEDEDGEDGEDEDEDGEEE